MPSGATSEPPQPPLLLLRQRLAALGLLQLGEEDGGRGEAREDEEEEDDSDAASPPLLLGPEGEGRPRAVMAAMLGRAYGEASAGSGGEEEKLRRKSVNSTECVAVPSSEHVAEIVGRQGCKIKALRAKTNTYIKTPVRGEPPVFVVTGRSEDVAAARREILSAAEHFSLLRAWRGRAGPSCVPALPGHTTAHVRVPYRVVGLVVGPRGATIKRIQQLTHTYIVTPSRDREPVFEVTGMPENVERARQEIEMHIALCTGGCTQLGHHCHHRGDFRATSTDLGSESSPARARTASGHRNGSSSSLGSASTDSFFGSSHLPDLSPTSPFGHGAFWFGEALPAVGTEEPALDSPLLDSPLLDSPLLDSPLLDSPLLDSPLLDSPLLDTPLLDSPLLDTPLLDTPLLDSLPTPSQPLWAPLEPVATSPGSARPPRHGSQPPTPRLSPTVPEGPEQPPARRSDPPGSGQQPVCAPAFSSGTDSYSSSNGGSACSSPPESRHDCVLCVQGEAMAALLPCGHNLFCLQCADGICEQDSPACPVCHSAVTQAVHTHC